MSRRRFEVQGHRGARGLRPENTLAGFELALDLGVSSIETDVYLTRDGVPVLYHEGGPLQSRGRPVADLVVSRITAAALRSYRVACDTSDRFPRQLPRAGPLTARHAAEHGIDPFGIPTLADLFALVETYAGAAGEECHKTPEARLHCAGVMLDLELKRTPFRPELIGDSFDGTAAGTLERRVLEEAERHGMLDRIRVRSFDHRSVRCIRELRQGCAPRC